MSELEDDLKRVLRQRVSGDSAGPDAMLGRVRAGARQLRRRRIASTAVVALAVGTTGTSLALGNGDLMDSKPPVVAPSTIAPTTAAPSTPAPSSGPQPTLGSTLPGESARPPIAGGTTIIPVRPTGSSSAGSTNTLPTATTTATRPTFGPLVISGFQASSVAPYGASTVRVLGRARCGSMTCYPVLVSQDGGASFRLWSEGAYQPVTHLGVGNAGGLWTYGPTTWVSNRTGSGWGRVADAPGPTLNVYNGQAAPIVLTRHGNTTALWKGGGVGSYYTRIEERFDRVDDWSTWGQSVTSGNYDGVVAVTVSNTDRLPRPTGCKSTATPSRVSAGPGNVIWLLCPTTPGHGTLLVSTTAGHTWRVVPAKLPPLGANPVLAARSATAAVLHPGTGSHLTLVSSTGQVSPATAASGAEYLRFQTPSVGYLVANGRVLRTSNGGTTWSQIGFGKFD